MKKQPSFSFATKPKRTHGGDLAKGKRKTERPLRMNKPIHLVLRARRSGLKIKEKKIRGLIKTYAEKFDIKVYQISVNSNHLHLALSIKRRLNFQSFLRAITGLIARLMGGKLWAQLAFTRIAAWGKEFRILLGYIKQNHLESVGQISYKPRRDLS